MALPDLIEIVPLDKPVRAEITVPGSKSITNRALILAALAEGEVTLEGALWSEDTQVMTEALVKLGFAIKVEADPEEFCNRRITVRGLGGRIPNAGTPEKPLELFVGNAGTAARFLAAMVCLGNGVYRLSGVPRMHERPQAALFKALRQLGYRVDSMNDKLPAMIFGKDSAIEKQRGFESVVPKYQGQLTSAASGGLHSCKVSISESSQFASALMLCARVGGWKIEVVNENAEESPYIVMTSKLIEVFPNRGGKLRVEPDASSGSYFLGVGESPEYMEYSERFGVEVVTKILNQVEVRDWPGSGWQIDERFREFSRFGPMFVAIESIQAESGQTGVFPTENAEKMLGLLDNLEISRATHLGDSIMLAIVLSALGHQVVRFSHLGRLRVQECERVVALRTELTKCGAKVVEEGDTLTVYPSQLHGAEIETYNDHRVAMCFAILGLKVPGIKLQNPACVKKTFPNFFQKLATPPPKGLGATILDGRTGRKLELEELFAD